jgi:tRNA/rRNA methyltransferase
MDKTLPELTRCRVVLVRPTIAANLGATARIMRNMGLRHLVLVAPEADPADQKARQLSTHGQEILDQARVVREFGDAVADCHLVVGSSARMGGRYRTQSAGTLEAIMPPVMTALQSGETALVFGPEASGLSNEEVTRCHYLIHIPADPAYPVLNLAQAVAICLYELRRTCLLSTAVPVTDVNAPTFAEQELLFAKLREALEAIHFLHGENAEALMHALRHLLGRAGPTAMEVDVLFGLARQIQWFADRRECANSQRESQSLS